jgi:deoxyribodipyrimidine photo-lyase
MGVLRARFLREGVLDLSRSLESKKSTLVVRYGDPVKDLAAIVKTLGCTAVHTIAGICDEELRLEESVRKALKVPLERYHSNTLVDLDQLGFDPMETPDVFTHFRKLVERNVVFRHPAGEPLIWKKDVSDQVGRDPLPEVLEMFEDLSESEMKSLGRETPFHGGESFAHERMNDYIWSNDCLKSYKETRNGMLGMNYSSKFSPWLAIGCLTSKQVVQQIRLYESRRIANDSTYWLIFELLWRDFFAFSAMKYGKRIFLQQGPQRKSVPWKQDEALFRQWCEGRTGYPLIDACLRELTATGFMSNRGRQIVASFLTKDMELDWRMGAEFFEEHLLDYDPCSNYGNWTYVAGVGSDPREDRYFNIVKQGSMYDPKCEFIRFWCPEISKLPDDILLNISRLQKQQRMMFSINFGIWPAVTVPLKFASFKTTKSSRFSAKK